MTAASDRRFRLCDHRIGPQLVGADQCVQDRDQFPHRSGERHFLEFSLRQQSLVERLDSGIESGGYKGRHIERAANTGTPSRSLSFTDRLAGILVDRSDSNELRDFLAIELSEFRQFGDDRADSHGANAFDGVQDLDFASVGFIGTDSVRDLLVERFELFFPGFSAPYRSSHECSCHASAANDFVPD